MDKKGLNSEMSQAVLFVFMLNDPKTIKACLAGEMDIQCKCLGAEVLGNRYIGKAPWQKEGPKAQRGSPSVAGRSDVSECSRER